MNYESWIECMYCHERYYSEPGEGIKIKYEPRYDKDGHWELVSVGMIDTDAEIQSHADSVDLHKMLKRFEAGEVDVFNRVQAQYGDFTQIPDTLAGWLNKANEVKNFFDSLPPEVKARFESSPEVFLASLDRPDFMEKFAPDQQKESEVKSDESEQ